MRAALAAALSGHAAIVFGDDLTAVTAVRTAPRDSGVVLLVLDGAVAVLERMMLLAAVAPLAVELAPATRLVALDLAAAAEPAAAIAAARYLVTAQSTTGQVLELR